MNVQIPTQQPTEPPPVKIQCGTPKPPHKPHPPHHPHKH